MDLDAHKAVLTSFAQSHLTGDPAKDNFINLKLSHSLHVHENAEKIIEGEEIEGKQAEICSLAALYHDIGRFPQFARFGTFNDKESVNHGRQGVLTLRDIDLPSDMSADDFRLIRLAIGQHNIKSIKADLADPYATPVKLVRDADKVDIFRVMVEHFSGDNPDPVVTYGYDDIPDKYTPAIYNAVMNGETGDYNLVRYANDFKLLIVGWLNDLHFLTSLRIIHERGNVESIFSFLPKNDEIFALKEKVEEFIRYNYSPAS